MKKDTFEEYEKLPESYHKDKRWKLVDKLRKQGRYPESNNLVLTIRESYGFGG